MMRSVSASREQRLLALPASAATALGARAVSPNWSRRCAAEDVVRCRRGGTLERPRQGSVQLARW